VSKADDKQMIAALLEERRGYIQRGDKKRVADVNEQLKLRGYEEPEEEKAKPEPAKQEPKGRAGRESRQTTADDAKPKATG
jgi:hypothetical protein